MQREHIWQALFSMSFKCEYKKVMVTSMIDEADCWMGANTVVLAAAGCCSPPVEVIGSLA